jgi:hypothetical protein
MLISCKLKTRGKPGIDANISFESLPRKGDLINPDSGGRGLSGYVEDVVWVWGDNASRYYPALIIKICDME